MTNFDPVSRPRHYNTHPSGLEAIEICAGMGFNLGNAFKYLWRAGIKAENPIEDLRKALWYVERERDFRESRVDRILRGMGSRAKLLKVMAVETETRANAFRALYDADGTPHHDVALITAAESVRAVLNEAEALQIAAHV